MLTVWVFRWLRLMVALVLAVPLRGAALQG